MKKNESAMMKTRRMMMMRNRRPLSIVPIDVNQVNAETRHHNQDDSLGILENTNTYRQEGVSIGPDYLRLEGSTVTRGELVPSSVMLMEVIGRGGFSTVRRAIWKRPLHFESFSSPPPPQQELSPSPSSLQQEQEEIHSKQTSTVEVAVKQCSLLLSTAQRRDMLLKELKALGRVDCPCLITLLGAFLDGDVVTMVLEYMNRGSLELLLDHLRENRTLSAAIATTSSSNSPITTSSSTTPRHHLFLPEVALAAISYQMLSGLAYLHAQRMLHRDVKPANVLMNSNGLIKLADFGIATISNTSAMMALSMSSCLASTVVGTAWYMSPERLRARPYGRSSDVWSLGLVLLELTLGQKPWSNNVTSLVELVLTMEETPIDELVPPLLTSIPPVSTTTTTNNNNNNDPSINNNNQSSNDDCERLREILVGCLHLQPEKRIPARILLESPWFDVHNIHVLSDATEKVQDFFQTLYSSSCSMYSTWWSVSPSTTGYTTTTTSTGDTPPSLAEYLSSSSQPSSWEE